MSELKIGDTVSLTVETYDPSRDSAPRLETYHIPYTREMRVLEALDYVVEELGQSLSYQWFCGVKKCGMCGVMVNGRQTLGCWEPVQPEMVVRPLAGFPVVRDLVIDRSRYFSDVQSLEPRMQRKRPYGGFPETITGAELAAAADTMHCIECMLWRTQAWGVRMGMSGSVVMDMLRNLIKDLAEAFLNAMLDPGVQTSIANKTYQGPTNKKVMLAPEVASRSTYGDRLTNIRFFDGRDVDAKRQAISEMLKTQVLPAWGE